MNTEDEFAGIDPDLRGLLDELVNTSLQAISTIGWAEIALTSNKTTVKDRTEALQAAIEANADLIEVHFCYLATIGYHQ